MSVCIISTTVEIVYNDSSQRTPTNSQKSTTVEIVYNDSRRYIHTWRKKSTTVEIVYNDSRDNICYFKRFVNFLLIFKERFYDAFRSIFSIKTGVYKLPLWVPALCELQPFIAGQPQIDFSYIFWLFYSVKQYQSFTSYIISSVCGSVFR